MSNTQFRNFSDAVAMAVSANSTVDSIAGVAGSVESIKAGDVIDKKELEKLLNDVVGLFENAAKEIKEKSGELFDSKTDSGKGDKKDEEKSKEWLKTFTNFGDKLKKEGNEGTNFAGRMGNAFSGFATDVFGAKGDQLNFVGDIVSTFGGDGAGVNRILKGVNDTAKGIGQMFTGIASGNPFGILNGAATAFMGIIGIIGKDDRLEKKIQKLKREVKDLERDLKGIERQSTKLYGTEKSANLDLEIENVQKQKKLVEEQLALERDKKKTDKEKVDAYKSQIDSLKYKLEDLKDSQITAIMGKDVSGAIDSFANAYVKAWGAGTDKAAAMKDVVKDMIRSSVLQLVKSNISGSVNDFAARLVQAMKNGVLSKEDQAYFDEFQKKIIEDAGNINESFNKYIAPDPTRTAASKGITSMTQDTAEELNGRFTAIQEHTASIKGSVQTLVNNGGEMLKTLFGIEQNTSRLAAIENNIVALRNGIDYINMKGVRLI